MAINLLFSGVTIPGSILTINEQLPPDGVYFLVNEDLDDDDIYPWGILLLRVFVPFPVAKPSTVFSLDLYSDSYALFEPYPRLSGVPVQFGIYSGERSKASPFSLYKEE